MTQPRAIVEQGYDAMADQYLAYMSAVTEDPRLRFLEMLETRLAPGSDVVDLGCGEVVTMDEPSGPSMFHWVLARLTDWTQLASVARDE